MNQAPKTANATYCATLCDQLWVDGLRMAFVAPGSRSTPLALALVAHPGITVEVVHDERTAAFAALGSGLATGRPALVLCSSGTAGAHFYAAVIEADASAVPLIVVTADRPPELWGRGAPQTIDQTNLYGHRVRDFVEPGPPDDLDPGAWRLVARRLWESATGRQPGPVHANLSFRDPLTGTPDELPVALPAAPVDTVPDVDASLVAEVQRHVSGCTGVIVAGRGETPAHVVLQLADQLGWPVIADHRSGCRVPDLPAAIRHFDSLLRDAQFAADHRPAVVIRVGEIMSSKSTSQWLTACAAAGTTVISSRPHQRHIDPEDIADITFVEAGFLAELGSRLELSAPDLTWRDCWIDADALASTAVVGALATAPHPNEISIAQACIAAVPNGGALVVSSSMPVRDIEWFGQNRNDIAVFANRGANGIDGVVATALGVALSGRPTVCLIGDVAFLHDSTSLIALRNRPVNLTVVVTNNDGGGIFSFLPQHELLDTSSYEELFGTPHGTDLATLATAHGLRPETFTGRIAAPAGVNIVIATTERSANLALHNRIHQAVATALQSHRG